MNNYATHKHLKVKEYTRISFLLPPHVNMVERFFGKITAERIRRGAFKSVLELTEAISYIETHNRNPKPYVWTKTAEEIINKLKPVYQMTNNTTIKKVLAEGKCGEVTSRAEEA